MLPLAARHVDVWHSFGSIDDMAAKSARLDEMARGFGRDPAHIRPAAHISLETDFDRLEDEIGRWGSAGFSYLIAGWPPEGASRVREFGNRFL